MKDAQIIGILPMIRLQSHETACQFTPNQLENVHSIWQTRPPHIFNGSQLVLKNYEILPESIHIEVCLCEYKFYYAQKQGLPLGLTPIGVSGLIVCQNHLIVAQRSQQVTAYPAYWEFAPSGSLDHALIRDDGSVDFVARLHEEFTEEVGLSAECITASQPFALIYDPNDPVYDIACQLTLDTSLDAILAAFEASEEYDRPQAVPLAEVEAWLTAQPEGVVPTSRSILTAWQQFRSEA